MDQKILWTWASLNMSFSQLCRNKTWWNLMNDLANYLIWTVTSTQWRCGSDSDWKSNIPFCWEALQTSAHRSCYRSLPEHYQEAVKLIPDTGQNDPVQHITSCSDTTLLMTPKHAVTSWTHTAVNLEKHRFYRKPDEIKSGFCWLMCGNNWSSGSRPQHNI